MPRPMTFKLFLKLPHLPQSQKVTLANLTTLICTLQLWPCVSPIVFAQSPRSEAIATKTLIPVLSLLLFETNDGLMTPPPFKFQLPDSGLLVGGNYPSGINADCSGVVIGQQGCSNGLDLSNGDDSDGKAGFSYTKLDVDGNDLSASAVSWSCVRDNITGFIWEIKTDDGGVRDKDNKYFWGGTGADGRNDASAHGEYYDDWNPFVAEA